MPTRPQPVDEMNLFDGGIADYPKNALPNEVAFLRSLDYRTDPHEIRLLPKTTKESGSVITDLPVAGDLVGTNVYLYGDTGNIYKRTSAGSVSLLRSVSNSHGNGMKYYTEDDFLYYPSDKVIGRYGQISGTPTFVDDFLGSEGGVPLNTYSLDLESSSSQHAKASDAASVSLTGDLAIEMSIKPESLPSAGNVMVLFSKWDVNSNHRSYKFEIYAASGYFGSGTDGSLTISSDTTEAPIDSACTGTSGSTSLSATNASFAANQIVLIHQTHGTGAGTHERNTIASYTAGTITLQNPLTANYVSGAQVRVMKQYTTVTINSGKTYKPKDWDGSTGGILAFLCSTSFTNSGGTVTSATTGFRGAPLTYDGEGNTTDYNVGVTGAPSDNAGGGGLGSNPSPNNHGGGGGGNGTAGSNDASNSSIGGHTSGSADLTTMTFGGSGGASGYVSGGAGGGGKSAGILFITAATFTNSGTISANGSDGTAGRVDENAGGGGAGAGGSILIKAQTATIGTMTATGGTGGAAGGLGGYAGGNGGSGRIHLDYYTSYTNSSPANPTLDVNQDNSLVTNVTYQLRLGLSSNGTAEEFLVRSSTITTATWFHVGVSWDASGSTATFFQDGVSLGTATGAVTSLNDNTSPVAIGADFNSTARNFYDGKIDEVRLWNTERTEAQMYANKGVQIATTTTGLAAYYQQNNNSDDSTASAVNMTNQNSPVYSQDVPFSSPTGREDLDQSLDTSGDTYALGTSISETSANIQEFVPNRDPQKSIEVNISDTGDDSDWTLTVHDSLNRTVASATVTHANLHTGDFEFTFSSVWRPIRGATYHFHLTATTTTGAPAVVATTNNNLNTADFHTYYQFLVEDTYHPVEQFLNFVVFGNERYVAKYAADGVYDPHRIVLPAGWRVRKFAIWKGLLAIGCVKGTNIYDTDQGMIFLWDGYAQTYTDAIAVPEGSINTMLSSRGVLSVWAGYHGDMLEYRGGDYAEIVKRVPKIENDEYIEILPNAVSMWDGLLRWGVGGVSNTGSVEKGVYTWGKRKASNPPSLSYDFPISTGTRVSTGVKIGFLFPVGGKLLIGWKDNTSYGLDVVDPTGNYFGTATIERSIRDEGAMYKQKQALLVRADFDDLPTGTTVKLKYKLDRASNWMEGASDNETGYAIAGDDYARLPIPQGSYKEVQIAADVTSTGSDTPVIRGLTLERDLKLTENIV